MEGGGRLRGLRTVIGLLLVLLGCICEYSTTSSLVVDAAAAASASAPKFSTAEANLRAAVTQTKKTTLRLTADVVLSANLPEMKCPDLVITGGCTTTRGRPRKCKIDGRNKFKGFFRMGAATNLTLNNLEIRGFFSLVDVAATGDVVIKDCVMTRNRFRSDASVNGVVYVTNVGLKVTNTLITQNQGTMLAAWYAGLYLTNVIFRANTGGRLFDYARGGLYCVKCGFENNTASGDRAVVEAGYGVMKFSDSWFVGNSRTKVGTRGGAVYFSEDDLPTRFCNCRFADNTITLPRGRRSLEHIYLAGPVEVDFCKKRPSTGLSFANRNASVNVKDSCANCP